LLAALLITCQKQKDKKSKQVINSFNNLTSVKYFKEEFLKRKNIYLQRSLNKIEREEEIKSYEREFKYLIG
jgi:hypothetical protein